MGELAEEVRTVGEGEVEAQPSPHPHPKEQDGCSFLFQLPAGQVGIRPTLGVAGSGWGWEERMLRAAPPQPRCQAARGTWGT